MRYLFLLALILIAGQAQAEDYYYQLNGYFPGTSLEDIHFPSPGEACVAAYDYEKTIDVPKRGDRYEMDPYQEPYVTTDIPPKYLAYMCIQSFRDRANDPDHAFTISASITRHGDNCKPNEIYNSISGYCEAPSEEQERKGLGDPDHSVLAGVVCRGDPINVANGNVFESEIDYADADGELVFKRIYNSLSGFWSNNYRTRLGEDEKSLLLSLPDGRKILFSKKDGLAIPEAGEFGSLTRVNGLWTYTSPNNEQFTFSGSLLTRWRKENGLTQTISNVYAPDMSLTTTATDSRGHILKTTRSAFGDMINLVVGDLTVTYTHDDSGHLTQVTRTVKGKTSTRSYAYEDASNPDKLTSITDERGVKYSSWSYDSIGRAVSNQLAGGADKVTLAYANDGSTTVTNALGQSTIYRYAIVQGVKRVTAIEGEPVAGCPASNSRYTYTDDGLMATRTDALGHVTAYSYDTQGRESKKIEAQGTPDERATTTTWDGTSFRPATVTTADRVTSYTYDANGRPLSTTVRSLKD